MQMRQPSYTGNLCSELQDTVSYQLLVVFGLVFIKSIGAEGCYKRSDTLF